jgi:hypothetical protein
MSRIDKFICIMVSTLTLITCDLFWIATLASKDLVLIMAAVHGMLWTLSVFFIFDMPMGEE